MEQSSLSRRAVLVVIVVGLVCAIGAAGGAYFMASNSEPRYRAETQVALLPARNTAPEDLSNFWEALSRGQAARIAAEVLGQRRWLAPAAQSAGVDVSSIDLSAGAVADTTLIDVALEAPSAEAAEAALDRVVIEARPVVEDVSGPFALEVVQSAAGSAEELGAAATQLLAVAGAAGLLMGSGIALVIVRSRLRRAEYRAAEHTADPFDADEPVDRVVAEPIVVGEETMALIAHGVRSNGHAVAAGPGGRATAGSANGYGGGPAGNGQAGNGQASNGQASNGRVTNGHAGNGGRAGGGAGPTPGRTGATPVNGRPPSPSRRDRPGAAPRQ